jgi:hypothetical protein
MLKNVNPCLKNSPLATIVIQYSFSDSFYIRCIFHPPAPPPTAAGPPILCHPKHQSGIFIIINIIRRMARRYDEVNNTNDVNRRSTFRILYTDGSSFQFSSIAISKFSYYRSLCGTYLLSTHFLLPAERCARGLRVHRE